MPNGRKSNEGDHYFEAECPGVREKQLQYLQKKQRDLNEIEKAQIRERIQAGDGNVYRLAEEFACVPVQVAGIKAAMARGQ
jgi:hypothetical protein